MKYLLVPINALIIDKYGVYANLDKLFIKKLFDIKLFLEQIKTGIESLRHCYS